MGKKQKFVLSSSGPEGVAAEFGRLITSPAWQDRRDEAIALYGAVVSANPATAARETAESRLSLALTGWKTGNFMPTQRAELAFATQMAVLAVQTTLPEHKDLETANLVAYESMFARVASQSPDYAIRMAAENLKAVETASPVAVKVMANSISGAALHMLRADRKTTLPGAATLPEKGIAVLAQLVDLSSVLDKTGNKACRKGLADQLEAATRREFFVAPFAAASALLMASAVSDDTVQKNRIATSFTEIVAELASPLQSNGLTSKDEGALTADRLSLTKLATLAAQVKQARPVPAALETALSAVGAPLPVLQLAKEDASVASSPRPVVETKPVRQFTVVARPARQDFWLKSSPSSLRYQKPAATSPASERYIAAMGPKPQG